MGRPPAGVVCPGCCKHFPTIWAQKAHANPCCPDRRPTVVADSTIRSAFANGVVLLIGLVETLDADLEVVARDGLSVLTIDTDDAGVFTAYCGVAA